LGGSVGTAGKKCKEKQRIRNYTVTGNCIKKTLGKGKGTRERTNPEKKPEEKTFNDSKKVPHGTEIKVQAKKVR